MKFKTNTQIPNAAVYAVLYAMIFGISIWVLITDREGPTNWVVYVVMFTSILAGAIKLGVHAWRRQRA